LGIVSQRLVQDGEPAAPSSHCSPLSTIRSPQRGRRQYVRHVSGASAFALPSSHSSVGDTMPSPQIDSGLATMHTSSSVQPPNSKPESDVRSQPIWT
jgi:hypothetical protein